MLVSLGGLRGKACGLVRFEQANVDGVDEVLYDTPKFYISLLTIFCIHCLSATCLMNPVAVIVIVLLLAMGVERPFSRETIYADV